MNWSRNQESGGVMKDDAMAFHFPSLPFPCLMSYDMLNPFREGSVLTTFTPLFYFLLFFGYFHKLSFLWVANRPGKACSCTVMYLYSITALYMQMDHTILEYSWGFGQKMIIIYMLLKLRLERDHYLSQLNIRWVAKCSRDDRLSWEYAILFYNLAVSLQFLFSFVYKINISCTQLVSSCFVQDQKMILCYCVLKILT